MTLSPAKALVQESHSHRWVFWGFLGKKKEVLEMCSSFICVKALFMVHSWSGLGLGLFLTLWCDFAS
jgi:hypothetical protein